MTALRQLLLLSASAALLLAQETEWKVTPAGTQVPVDTFPMSQAITPDGKLLLVLNAGFNPPSVSVIDLASGKEIDRGNVPDGWLGLTLNKAGDRVYVGGGSKAAVYEFTFAAGKLTPSRMFPVVADKDRTKDDFVGDVQFSPDGHLLYATNLFRDSVVVINPQSGLVISRIKTGRRPYRILFHKSGRSLYVSSWADGSIGQYDANSGAPLGTTRVGPHATDMLWADGLVDGQPSLKARLFVSASNTNSLFVLGASETGELSRLETINLALTPRQPAGTTPEGMGISADRKQLYVACAGVNAVAVIDLAGERVRTLGFIPAGHYPVSALGLPGGRVSILNSHDKTVQIVEAADESKLPPLTDQVMANLPYRDILLTDPGIPAGSPVRPNGPVKHVVYVIRGDDTLAATGIRTDYAEKLSPTTSAGRRAPSDDALDPANTPPAGYLWTNAAEAGISMRNYGFFVTNLQTPGADGTEVQSVRDAVLAKATDTEYRGADPAYADADRAREFISELHEYEQTGSYPQLVLVRLDGGKDYDQAVAAIAEAVSKSRFANETAIFTPGGIRSPWTNQTAAISPLSALRTVEIILGMRPMTIFDAAAPPLFSAFAGTR